MERGNVTQSPICLSLDTRSAFDLYKQRSRQGWVKGKCLDVAAISNTQSPKLCLRRIHGDTIAHLLEVIVRVCIS